MRRASYRSFLRRSLCVAMTATALFLASCGDDPTTPTPTPSPSPTPTPQPSVKASEVVKWMDERLQKEYMWMDEYKEKHSQIDLSLEWDKFLPGNLLKKLTTNTDDGEMNSKGEHTSLYTNVSRRRDISSQSSTRALPTVYGYGIELSPYYVGVSSIEGYTENNCGFVIEHVYPGSVADEAGLSRGDLILQIDNKKITESSIATLWTKLVDANSSNNINITAQIYDEEAKEYRIEEHKLTASNYESNPVAFCDVLTLDEKYGAADKKIGYMVYLAFDHDYNDAMVDAIKELSKQGITDMILDLRANSGGHVTSSIMLASMLLDESYVGDDKVTDPETRITKEMIDGEGLLIRRGKKAYHVLMLKK